MERLVSHVVIVCVMSNSISNSRNIAIWCNKSGRLCSFYHIAIKPYMAHIGCIIIAQDLECTWVSPFQYLIAIIKPIISMVNI